jgi:hypothetical protein
MRDYTRFHRQDEAASSALQAQKGVHRTIRGFPSMALEQRTAGHPSPSTGMCTVHRPGQIKLLRESIG